VAVEEQFGQKVFWPKLHMYEGVECI
jgi:hypothetical protein